MPCGCYVQIKIEFVDWETFQAYMGKVQLVYHNGQERQNKLLVLLLYKTSCSWHSVHQVYSHYTGIDTSPSTEGRQIKALMLMPPPPRLFWK